jgi:hypothetical protein
MIEEDLLRWRAGRLADLGFVAWEEAMKLLRPLDLKAARDAETANDVRHRALHAGTPRLAGRARRPAAPRPRGASPRAAGRARPRVHPPRQRADGRPALRARRRKLQERAFHQAEATVGLGLELLAGGLAEPTEVDALLAGRITAIGLRGVFRVGYGPLDKLRRAALALHREGRVSLTRTGSLLDRPWGPALEPPSPAWYPELPLESTSTGVRPLAGLQATSPAPPS